jgi:hypothetical protein
MPRYDEENQIVSVSKGERLETPVSAQSFGTGVGGFKDTLLEDLKVAYNAVRIWKSGVRVANGKGFLCAPPDESKPSKTNDYLRIWVDKLVYGGYGVVGLPMSDQLWFNATGLAEYKAVTAATTSGSDVLTVNTTVGIDIGDNIREYSGSTAVNPPTKIARGSYVKKVLTATTLQMTRNAIGTGSSLTVRVGLNADVLLKLLGPQVVGADSTGIIDCYGVLDLLQGSDVVETSGFYDDKGAVYFNTTSNKIRWYNGTAWADLGGSGGSTIKKSSHTHSAATTGAIDYAHGLGSVPTHIRLQANYSGSFSDGSYDGTLQNTMYWGTGAGISSASIVYIDNGSGNISFGKITAMDATNITITWDKSGTPTGTATLLLEAS